MLLALLGLLEMLALEMLVAFGEKDHLWQGCYTLIHRANLAISKISAMSNISQESKTDAIGQLSFFESMGIF